MVDLRIRDEQKVGRFPFSPHPHCVHWYNIDVSGWPLRKLLYQRQTRTAALKTFWQRFDDLQFYCHLVLDAHGIVTPKYLMNVVSGEMWVHDTSFDLSHIPEYRLCLKAGLEARTAFDYDQHGAWCDWAKAHMYRAIGRDDLCAKFLTHWRDFYIKLRAGWPDGKAYYSAATWPYPSWYDRWLAALGASGRIV